MSKRKFEYAEEEQSVSEDAEQDVSTATAIQLVCGIDGCVKSYKNINALKNHQTESKQHGDPNKYRCDFPGCKSSYFSKGSFNYHKKTHTLAKDAFPCPLCDSSYQQKRRLKVHMRSCHSDKPKNFKCIECVQSFFTTAALKQHVDTVHLLLKPFACDLCDQKCSSQGNLDQHMAAKHSEEKFLCRLDNDCCRQFNTTRARDEHERSHTGETPYLCDVGNCIARLRTSHQLRMHKMDHGMRPYACTYCHAKFKVLSQWTEHTRIHTGEKPYCCDRHNCNAKFTHSTSLVEHILRHHSDRREYCTFDGCGRAFINKNDVKNHFKAIHEKDNSEKRLNSAELRIAKILTDANIPFDREQTIKFSCIDEGKHQYARLDFVIATDEAVIILEVDETQHKQNDTACEVARMVRVHSAIALGGLFGLDHIPPVLWIRYNPNQHRLDGRLKKASSLSNLTDREAALLDVIANPNLGDRSAGILYMYYDSKTQTNADGSTTIVPLVVDSPDYVAFMREMVLPAIA